MDDRAHPCSPRTARFGECVRHKDDNDYYTDNDGDDDRSRRRRQQRCRSVENVFSEPIAVPRRTFLRNALHCSSTRGKRSENGDWLRPTGPARRLPMLRQASLMEPSFWGSFRVFVFHFVSCSSKLMVGRKNKTKREETKGAQQSHSRRKLWF